jgi:hypothetical protein
MRRRTKLILSGMALALSVLVMWLVIPSKPQEVLTFSVDGTRQGARPGATGWINLDPKSGMPDNFIALASFTNNGRTALGLLPPLVEWHKSNSPRSFTIERWRGMLTPTGQLAQIRLPPKAVAELPISPPLPEYPPHPELRPQKLRFEFDYTANAGPVQRGISTIVAKVPVKLMPKRLGDWLFRNGFMDGYLHRRYESVWVPYPFEKPMERGAH